MNRGAIKDNSLEIEKLLKDNNLTAEFEMIQMVAFSEGLKINTGEYAIIDKTKNRFIRSCKPNYYILHNDIFVDSVMKSIGDYKIIGLDVFKENDGILAFIDSKINVPGELKKYIRSIDVVIIDGITQASSLASGLKINLTNGGFILYFPESCKGNKRNIKDINIRISTTKKVFKQGLIEVNLFIDKLMKLSSINIEFDDIENFVSEVYGQNNNDSSKKETNILGLTNGIEFRNFSDKSLVSAYISVMEFIYDNAVKSRDGDIIQYLFLSKGKLDTERMFIHLDKSLENNCK